MEGESLEERGVTAWLSFAIRHSPFAPIMVGLGRLERPTSPLSGVRSNHLSYRPLGASSE